MGSQGSQEPRRLVSNGVILEGRLKIQPETLRRARAVAPAQHPAARVCDAPVVISRQRAGVIRLGEPVDFEFGQRIGITLGVAGKNLALAPFGKKPAYGQGRQAQLSARHTHASDGINSAALPPGTDKTAMDFRRTLPEIRWQSCLSPVPGPSAPALRRFLSGRLSLQSKMVLAGSARDETPKCPLSILFCPESSEPRTSVKSKPCCRRWPLSPRWNPRCASSPISTWPLRLLNSKKESLKAPPSTTS